MGGEAPREPAGDAAAAAEARVSLVGEFGRDMDWLTASGLEEDLGRDLGTRWMVQPSERPPTSLIRTGDCGKRG